MTYFVLVTDTHFGVFRIDAVDYPDAFLENLSCATCVKSSELNSYLLEKVGRNRLITTGFNLYTGIGILYDMKR